MQCCGGGGTIFVSHSFRGTCRRFLGVQLGRFGFMFTCPLTCADKPAIVALLHHIHNVALVKLHFIIILWLVVVKCAEPEQASGDFQLDELTVWAQACWCHWTWRSLAGRGWSRGWRNPGSTWASHTGAGKTTGAVTHSVERVERLVPSSPLILSELPGQQQAWWEAEGCPLLAPMLRCYKEVGVIKLTVRMST